MKEKNGFVGTAVKLVPVVAIVAILSLTNVWYEFGVQGATLSPIADAGGPYTGWTGEPIIFDGSGSHDPSGTIINYTWDFGDGHKGYGEITTHTYVAAGTYIVTLTVVSNAYEVDTDASHAYIYEHNWAPVADAGGPYYGNAGISITFNGCGVMTQTEQLFHIPGVLGMAPMEAVQHLPTFTPVRAHISSP